MIARRGADGDGGPAPNGMGGGLDESLRALFALGGPTLGGQGLAAGAAEPGGSPAAATPPAVGEVQPAGGGATAGAGGDAGVDDVRIGDLGGQGGLDGLGGGMGQAMEEAASRAESAIAGVESVFSDKLPAGLTDLGAEKGGPVEADAGRSERPSTGLMDPGAETGVTGGQGAGPSEGRPTGPTGLTAEPAGPAGCGCEDCAECAGGKVGAA